MSKFQTKWWGYIHTNGGIQVKTYFNHEDIFDAHDSPFVAAVYGPFEASNREEALREVARRHKEE